MVFGVWFGEVPEGPPSGGSLYPTIYCPRLALLFRRETSISVLRLFTLPQVALGFQPNWVRSSTVLPRFGSCGFFASTTNDQCPIRLVSMARPERLTEPLTVTRRIIMQGTPSRIAKGHSLPTACGAWFQVQSPLTGFFHLSIALLVYYCH